MTQLFKFLLLALISFYQKYLSPIKGYKCAYGRHYHTHTCSSYGKKVVLRFGPWIGLRLLSRQFDACAWTNRTYFKANRPIKTQMHNYQAGYIDCAPDCISCDSCDCQSCDLNPFGENKFLGDNCSFGDSSEKRADRHEKRKNGKRISSKSETQETDEA